MNGFVVALIAAILLTISSLDVPPAGSARTCLPQNGWVRICR